MDSGEIDGALEAAKRAIELGPEIATAHNLAANVLKEAGDIAGAIAALDRAVELQKDDAIFHSNKVYLLEYDPRCDAAGLLAEQRRWNDRHAKPIEKAYPPPRKRPRARSPPADWICLAVFPGSRSGFFPRSAFRIARSRAV